MWPAWKPIVIRALYIAGYTVLTALCFSLPGSTFPAQTSDCVMLMPGIILVASVAFIGRLSIVGCPSQVLWWGIVVTYTDESCWTVFMRLAAATSAECKDQQKNEHMLVQHSKALSVLPCMVPHQPSPSPLGPTLTSIRVGKCVYRCSPALLISLRVFLHDWTVGMQSNRTRTLWTYNVMKKEMT